MTSEAGNHSNLRTGILWSAFERFAVQGLQFIVFIFMARALSPTDYGLVGMLAFFIVISQLVAEGGLSQAIIRKLDHSDKDLSTSFYINIISGVLLYIILYSCAPMIAAFYAEPALVKLLRVMAVCIIIQSSLVVHRAILTSRLDFKTQAKSTLVGALFSGLIGIYMAYNGYGAWAIVGLQLTNQLATALSLWIVTDWRPGLLFSAASFKSLYGFGSKLLMSKVIENIYNSVQILAIGKIFSAYALGSYTNARQLGSIASENLTRIVHRAAFPLFCKFQEDECKLRYSIYNYLRLATFIIAPLMLGLAAISQPLTTTLIGQQWLYTSRLLRILCVYFMFFPLNSINYMILEINGNGNRYLKLQISNVVIGIIILCCTIPFGLSAVCIGLVASVSLSYIINASLCGGSIGLGLRSQLKAISPIVINATIMALIVYSLQFLITEAWIQIMLGLITGVIVYGGLSLVFQTSLCKTATSLFK